MKENKKREVAQYEGTEVETTRDEQIYVPATDIHEKEDAILVRCDMPGVSEDRLEVTLEHYELTISGRQEPVPLGEECNPFSIEYGTGTFKRVFKIPQQIDRDRIKAHLRNGVLDIELPKAEQAKPRRIEIMAG